MLLNAPCLGSDLPEAPYSNYLIDNQFHLEVGIAIARARRALPLVKMDGISSPASRALFSGPERR